MRVECASWLLARRAIKKKKSRKNVYTRKMRTVSRCWNRGGGLFSRRCSPEVRESRDTPETIGQKSVMTKSADSEQPGTGELLERGFEQDGMGFVCDSNARVCMLLSVCVVEKKSRKLFFRRFAPGSRWNGARTRRRDGACAREL